MSERDWNDAYRADPSAPKRAGDNARRYEPNGGAGDGAKASRLIKSSGEFIASYTAPSYLIDGVLQQNRLYTITGKTGAGKTAVKLLVAYSAATGTLLSDRDVERCPVLYLSGENPDDVKARWLAMSDHMNFDPNKIDVFFVDGAVTISKCRERIEQEMRAIGLFGLVIVDTSAAFFEGADENDNVQAGKHARMLRELTELPGRPTALVSCHPVKNATEGNLLPRGGGALLAEVDGNLTCINANQIAEVYWQGKFRGPDFEALNFELQTVSSATVKDAKGKLIPTVMARALTEIQHDKRMAEGFEADERLLIAMLGHDASLSYLAAQVNWITKGQPHKTRVKRKLEAFEKSKLVAREAGKWNLTDKGRKKAEAAKARHEKAGARY
jgi:hypothetical protein